MLETCFHCHCRAGQGSERHKVPRQSFRVQILQEPPLRIRLLGLASIRTCCPIPVVPTSLWLSWWTLQRAARTSLTGPRGLQDWPRGEGWWPVWPDGRGYCWDRCNDLFLSSLCPLWWFLEGPDPAKAPGLSTGEWPVKVRFHRIFSHLFTSHLYI